jgi:hypothetical protein
MALRPGPEEREGRRRRAKGQHRVSGKFAVRPEVERERLIAGIERTVQGVTANEQAWWWACESLPELPELLERCGMQSPNFCAPAQDEARKDTLRRNLSLRDQMRLRELDLLDELGRTGQELRDREPYNSCERVDEGVVKRRDKLYEELSGEATEESTEQLDEAPNDALLSAARAWRATPVGAAQARLRRELDGTLDPEPDRPGLRYL